MQAFDKATFVPSFEASLKKLATAEKVTKAELLTLSRTVLEAHHETQDVSYINRLLAVLSPVNKRVAALYFQTFSGFQYDKEGMLFTRKDKKGYDEAHKRAMEFLEDPLNNIWSWSAKEVQMEAKPFDIERMKKALEQTLKRAEENDFTQVQVLECMMEAGLKLDTLMALMDRITGQEAAAAA